MSITTAEMSPPTRSSSLSGVAPDRNPIIVRRELRNYASQIFDYTLKMLDATGNPSTSSSSSSSSSSPSSSSQRRGRGSSSTTSSNGSMNGAGTMDEVDEGRKARGSRTYGSHGI